MTATSGRGREERVESEGEKVKGAEG